MEEFLDTWDEEKEVKERISGLYLQQLDEFWRENTGGSSKFARGVEIVQY